MFQPIIEHSHSILFSVSLIYNDNAGKIIIILFSSFGGFATFDFAVFVLNRMNQTLFICRWVFSRLVCV